MRKKLREVERELTEAGFRKIQGRGKGSHTWWEFVTSSGEMIRCNIPLPKGDMVLDYTVKEVDAAIRKSRGEI